MKQISTSYPDVVGPSLPSHTNLPNHSQLQPNSAVLGICFCFLYKMLFLCISACLKYIVSLIIEANAKYFDKAESLPSF